MENWLTSSSNRYLLFLALAGLILIGAGVLYFTRLSLPQTKVEVLEDVKNASVSGKMITVEISGEVVRPGVYKLMEGERIDDLLVLSGGFSGNADRTWIDKYLNRAAKLSDGQKLYIPRKGELAPYQDQQSSVRGANNGGGYQSASGLNPSDSNALININSASLTQLDSLPGIGQVYGQSIIDHRPYSTLQELVSKGAIKQSLYEKIKNLISVY